MCQDRLPAICVTVTEGPCCLLNGRALRVAESRMLDSLLTEVCGTSNGYHVEHVQSVCTTEKTSILGGFVRRCRTSYRIWKSVIFFEVTSKCSVVTVETTTDQPWSVTEVLMS